MVFIQGGTLWRGAKGEGEFDEKPAREVTIHSYFIDLYEVTNAQYQQFVEKTNRHRQEVMVFLTMSPSYSTGSSRRRRLLV